MTCPNCGSILKHPETGQFTNYNPDKPKVNIPAKPVNIVLNNVLFNSKTKKFSFKTREDIDSDKEFSPDDVEKIREKARDQFDDMPRVKDDYVSDEFQSMVDPGFMKKDKRDDYIDRDEINKSCLDLAIDG